MRNRERVVEVVGEWVRKAESDLKNAANTLKMGEDCPTDTVCFHAQQVVEKYLKALLVLEGTSFPKTHHIEELLALVSSALRPELSDEEQYRLTDYATVTRYPGDYELIPLGEARRAVSAARRVRREIRKLLPRESLVRRWR